MNGHSDILIIGGGIAGMTAALYAARANLSVRIVEKEVCGGLVNWTHTVENVPSYKSIHGMDLMTACREHVESLGVAIEEVNEVEEVRLDGQPKEIRTSEGDSFTADVVIIATGRKPIPLPVETAFEKVHYCSVCDGTAYKDKDVLVVGGGNSGFDESLYLAGLGVRSVHIVEMFPACAAAQSTQPGSGYRHHQGKREHHHHRAGPAAGRTLPRLAQGCSIGGRLRGNRGRRVLLHRPETEYRSP